MVTVVQIGAITDGARSAYDEYDAVVWRRHVFQQTARWRSNHLQTVTTPEIAAIEHDAVRSAHRLAEARDEELESRPRGFGG